ncbi:protein ANTI-SILENCING 1 [Gastrolobium bilobum]|uniref:protein ANTI-SILENCING 1 n=1 Tax=Gastrolobium bilobum TaxID=150636 RepID=UPI002AB2EFAC|nr:protein ANTI-SILENCING 1 [Gastrolobium bilobum]
MVEADKGEEDLEFKWGKKKGVGCRMRDVQFYESFTYDGEEYTLFDSVFLYKEGEPEPYIGKLIKIFEGPDKIKRVKILWYFRPCEIVNFLGGTNTHKNELFLARGEGLGLTNINPLEAIAGKCNVVCISEDSRNPHPSDEECQKAEFVFYRFFDVGQRKILDKIDDKIAGIEVKNIFNNLDSQKPVGLAKLGLDKKEVGGNVMKSNEVVTLSSQKNNKPIIEKPDSKCFDTKVRKNVDSMPLLGVKPTSSIGVKETSKSNDAWHNISSDMAMPQAKVKENGVSKASLVQKKSSSKLSHGSRAGLEMREIERGECEVVGVPLGQINKRQMEDKAKISNRFQNRRLVAFNDDDDDDDDDDVKNIGPSSSKDKYKLQRAKDSCDVDEVSSKKLKIEKRLTNPSIDKLRKESSMVSLDMEHKPPTEVTRRPDIDRSKWFRSFPWEERLKAAYEQGKLVLLENLDPSLTSSDVQDIVWHGLKESCTAKLIQKTAFSSPYSGQAFVIFKRKEAAELVVRKLDEGCFLMSNGRPLVGSFGIPCFPEKKQIFYGHHVVDQLRLYKLRDMKDAVSTSHCSQPNNIEYDMAIEWCLLQEKADKSWRRLYERQGKELSKLKAKLKSIKSE